MKDGAIGKAATNRHVSSIGQDTLAASPDRMDQINESIQTLHGQPRSSGVHFLDHAVYRHAIDPVSGVLREEIEGACFASPCFYFGHGSSGDGLTCTEAVRRHSCKAMPTAKVHGGSVGELYAQEDRLRIFQVGVLLQDANGSAAVPDDQVTRFNFFNRRGCARRVDERSFWNAGEDRLDAGERQGGANQATDQTAPGKCRNHQRNGEGGGD